MEIHFFSFSWPYTGIIDPWTVELESPYFSSFEKRFAQSGMKEERLSAKDVTHSPEASLTGHFVNGVIIGNKYICKWGNFGFFSLVV